jgi:hypothetical protein
MTTLQSGYFTSSSKKKNCENSLKKINFKVLSLKTLIFGFIFLIFAFSCKQQAVEPEPLPQQSQTSSLKAATLGTTYYVAKTGNDGNPGTLASPFLTIVRASLAAHPGDVVIVRDGTYTSTAKYMNMLMCSGTPGNYITFQSENKYGAVLDGINVSGYCFSLAYGASYLKFIDFEIKNFLWFAFDINHADYISSYITIQGCKIRDIGRVEDTGNYGKSGIYIGQKNHHITIDKNLLYNIGRTGPSTYWLNKDHAIYMADPYPDISANASHHNYITNNVIWGTSGPAITMGSNNDLIANNVIAWSNENAQGGGCFIAATSSGCFSETIVNNIFYQPPVKNAFVIVSYAGYSGWSVANNIVYGGRMWDPESRAGYAAAMAGGNYGRTDCEYGEVNPLFESAVRASAPSVDFRLQANSPAINAGVNVGLTSDYYKNAIVGKPDIGALEYTGSNASSLVYYNTQISATASRNDCRIGYIGSTVNYTIAAKKYSSSISQADADNKALSDLNTNKQAYANAYGTCNAAAMTYYNVAITATGTKNDCGGGRTGSTVTGTLPAKSFYSVISQADADNQAIVYVNAHKQAYFNLNGGCY